MEFRVGFGYDIHRLARGYKLWLGGVLLPGKLGALGHSDADALIHALCDALLGAAGLPDIGQQFPDGDPAYKGIDSKLLLGKVMELIREKGFSVGNIDITVCLESPKIAGFIPDMKMALCPLLGVNDEKLSIKATTKEGADAVGRSEAVEAYAVALIVAGA